VWSWRDYWFNILETVFTKAASLCWLHLVCANVEEYLCGLINIQHSLSLSQRQSAGRREGWWDENRENEKERCDSCPARLCPCFSSSSSLPFSPPCVLAWTPFVSQREACKDGKKIIKSNNFHVYFCVSSFLFFIFIVLLSPFVMSSLPTLLPHLSLCFSFLSASCVPGYCSPRSQLLVWAACYWLKEAE